MISKKYDNIDQLWTKYPLWQKIILYKILSSEQYDKQRFYCILLFLCILSLAQNLLSLSTNLHNII